MDDNNIIKDFIDKAISQLVFSTGVHFRIVYNLSTNLHIGFSSSFCRYDAYVYYRNNLVHTISNTQLTAEEAKQYTLREVLIWLITGRMHCLDME